MRVAALPTTYAGSEMTSIYGITQGGAKHTGRDERVRPVLVVYDPELTLELPAPISVVSALNAVAHAVEALYGPGIDPVTTFMAEESLRSLAAAIPALAREPRALPAREQALYGAQLPRVSPCAAVRDGRRGDGGQHRTAMPRPQRLRGGPVLRAGARARGDFPPT